MTMRTTFLAAACIAATLAASSNARCDEARQAGPGRYRHVLLISVDGLHASDLRYYVDAHPRSALAALAKHGVVYPRALTSAPSDSFPGLLAQFTGGSPKSHGVYYDVSFDRTLYAPKSGCKGAPGAQTAFDESIDRDPKKADGGGTLGKTLTQIDPAALPLALRDGRCVAVYPHEFVKTNTVFEIIRDAGLRTAWADKHPAYDIVNGPSGRGVADLFTPEVNSNDPVTKQDTTTGFHSVQRNDQLKVNAVLNEIAGLDSTGKTYAGVPAIFGMDFQAVSVGQKLAKGNPADGQDAGLVGGYADAAGKQPNSGLASALDYVDQQLGSFASAMERAKIAADTLVIVSAKHGQSPIDLALRAAVSDAPYQQAPGYAASITDDVGLVWLDPAKQKSSYGAAEAYLKGQASTLGIARLLDRDELSRLYNDPFSDARTPDFVAITRKGLIYTGGSKLAEHGGFADDDRNVALLVSAPPLHAATIDAAVETRQIAPTILKALGLDAKRLQAAVAEHTDPLPGVVGGGRGEREDDRR